MSQKSFAQILKEFNTKAPPTESFDNRQLHSFSANTHAHSNANQTHFELNQISLLKNNFAANKEPLFQFKSKNPYASFQATKPSQGQKEAPKYRTKKRNTSSSETPKTTQEKVIHIKKRVQGVPHKLSEIQTTSLTYFIQNLEFLLEDFTQEELKRSFKRLCFKMHPDQSSTGSTQSFIELKKHYDTLNLIFKKPRSNP